MKVIEAIENAKQLRPTGIDDNTLLMFLNEIESTIQSEVMKKDSKDIIKYSLGVDNDVDLLMYVPYDTAYVTYIVAKIDFYLQEFASYNNTIDMFNNTYEDFKKDYIRKNNPLSNLKISNYYY